MLLQPAATHPLHAVAVHVLHAPLAPPEVELQLQRPCHADRCVCLAR
jgi:hypothetical protein